MHSPILGVVNVTGEFEDCGRWCSDIGLKLEVFAGVICRCGAGVFDQSSCVMVFNDVLGPL